MSDSTPGPIKVLIVDDDDLVGQGLSRCLEVPDIHVVAVTRSSATAVAAAIEHQPDVVLLDRRLGAEDGVDVARRLIADNPAAKVIIITADPNPDVQEAARQAGCCGCIAKDLQSARALPEFVRQAHRGERLDST